MEKCTRSSHGFFSDLHYDHCVHHCEKKCNGNHPHHPSDPKPDHPHHPKEPKSSYEDKMVDCMEKCTRSSRGFFSDLLYDHCLHHCEKKCNGNHPHHPKDPKPDHPHHPKEPKPDHPHHPKEPKSSYEDKMVDCMEKCTRSSRGFFSDLHYDHCHHHCEKKCNGNHPHHPKDPKPDHPHHPKD